jgi:hypothetical protein
MKILQPPVYQKIFFIISYILFGLVLGALASWFHHRFDQWFWFNIPGDLFYSVPVSNYIVSSVIAWTLIGALLVFSFRPRILAWIMGVYIIVFGGVWFWWEAIHW